jgi:hypothetical protein
MLGLAGEIVETRETNFLEAQITTHPMIKETDSDKMTKVINLIACFYAFRQILLLGFTTGCGSA